ncbi:head GIN domain-containing protein [Roseateles sp. BYS78W]|uniref:Head GIN domain-containing protein n=1 Tax=Pelomonas candidula TaxID=3299025 RepID=A0ABW7HJ94_9BURK
MNTSRRLVALGLVAASLCGAAEAWSWGSSERVTGNGDVATEVRDTGAFDGVALSGGFNVVIRQGKGGKVEVKADRNLLPYIETDVVDGSKGRTLRIGPRKNTSFSTSFTPSLVIEMPALRAVSVAGSGKVQVEAMKTGGVDADIAGSGDIRFAQLDAERLGMRVSGSGDIVAAGRCNNAHVSIAGSGDVRAVDLAADEVKVSIAGSGDAQVNAAKRLNVSIAGSGDVKYTGSPEITSSIAGSGKVRRLEK